MWTAEKPAAEFAHESDFLFVVEVTALLSALFHTTGRISPAKLTDVEFILTNDLINFISLLLSLCPGICLFPIWGPGLSTAWVLYLLPSK